MIKKIFVILLLVLTLSSCTKEDPRLDRPVYIEYKDGFINFSEVEEATHYVLLINFDEHIIETNKYQLIAEGSYIVSVKARAEGYQDSAYSAPINFTISYPIPTNIKIDEYIISWDQMPKALHYEVLINDVLYPNITSPQIVVNPYKESINFQVKAIYLFDESNYSYPILFPKNETIKEERTYYYSKNSTFDLEIHNFSSWYEYLNSFKLGDEDILDPNFYYDNFKYYLESDYLQSLDIGLHEFKLSTSRGNHLIKINITDSLNPYIIRPTQNFYYYRTYVFEFELFGGQILSLSGNGITTDDYRIEDHKVIIDFRFTTPKFDEEPDRNNLILSYSIEVGNDLFIGFLTIKRP